MKLLLIPLIALLILLVDGSGATAQEPAPAGVSDIQSLVGTAFTYQGRLTDTGQPANGTYDFQFKLYGEPTSTNQVSYPVNTDDVVVSEGLFTVQLDFGSGAFNGDARYLEIGVRPGSSNDAYTTLSPRQVLTPAPYALALPGLWTQPNATSPNLIGGYSGNSVAPGVAGVTIGGGGASNTPNQVTADYATVGGGEGNTAGGKWSTVGGGFSNTAGDFNATVGGGHLNTAGSASTTVSGGFQNAAGGVMATIGGGLLNDASGNWATVGGGEANVASGSHATVPGGYLNRAEGERATVSGGEKNTASDRTATVGGGQENTASGGGATVGGGTLNKASGSSTTIGGGFSNTANVNNATVGGGVFNMAGGGSATIAGGFRNTASGESATVPGGTENTAAGDTSFAAGRRARANHHGTFVWGDATDADVASTGDNQFVVRASGGVWFYSNSAATTGVSLAPGSGAWSNLSDRETKTNYTPVDGRDVLVRLATVPINIWSYKAQAPSIRHVGPSAQDFYATFGLGEDDRHISTVDADGVALAAIQGLYQLVQRQDTQIAAQQERIVELEARLVVLEQPIGVSHASRGSIPAEWPLFGGLILTGLMLGQLGRRGGRR